MSFGRRVLTTLVLAATVAACGGVHKKVTVQPSGPRGFKEVALAPVEVTSVEQSAEALRLNEQWKAMAGEELQSVLADKGIAIFNDADSIISCKIHVRYGSRALRYLIGFGAGSGHMKVEVQLRDDTGRVQYATEGAADLAIGAFGGDMAAVARKTIREAIKDFGSRL